MCTYDPGVGVHVPSPSSLWSCCVSLRAWCVYNFSIQGFSWSTYALSQVHQCIFCLREHSYCDFFVFFRLRWRKIYLSRQLRSLRRVSASFTGTKVWHWVTQLMRWVWHLQLVNFNTWLYFRYSLLLILTVIKLSWEWSMHCIRHSYQWWTRFQIQSPSVTCL